MQSRSAKLHVAALFVARPSLSLSVHPGVAVTVLLLTVLFSLPQEPDLAIRQMIRPPSSVGD
jgi:hypothetical protein